MGARRRFRLRLVRRYAGFGLRRRLVRRRRARPCTGLVCARLGRTRLICTWLGRARLRSARLGSTGLVIGLERRVPLLIVQLVRRSISGLGAKSIIGAEVEDRLAIDVPEIDKRVLHTLGKARIGQHIGPVTGCERRNGAELSPSQWQRRGAAGCVPVHRGPRHGRVSSVVIEHCVIEVSIVAVDQIFDSAGRRAVTQRHSRTHHRRHPA